MTFSLVEAENQHLLRPDQLRSTRPGFWPSEASVEFWKAGRLVVWGTCMRAAWYRATGALVPGEPSPGLLMKGDLGKGVERSQIERWKQMGLWVNNNVKFYNSEHMLSGEVDAVLRNPLTGGLMGVEGKSFYGFGANQSIAGAKGKKSPGQPKDGHFLQAILYAFEYRHKLEEFRLMYTERGDGHRIEFNIGVTQRADGRHVPYWEQIPGPYWNVFQPGPVPVDFTIEDIYDRFKLLTHHVNTSSPPPRDFQAVYSPETVQDLWSRGEISKSKYEAWRKNPQKYKIKDWHCDYCRHSDTCQLESE